MISYTIYVFLMKNNLNLSEKLAKVILHNGKAMGLNAIRITIDYLIEISTTIDKILVVVK